MLNKFDVYNAELVMHLAEIVKDRLYFATLYSNAKPKTTADLHFFSIDDKLVYESFYSDFGPLNLGMMYRYCSKLNKKIKAYSLAKKCIVHFSTANFEKRLNAALLIGSYAILYCQQTPEQVYKSLTSPPSPAFSSFRDASFGICTYRLDLKDCLSAVHKAHKHKFLDFEHFNLEEYEYYEKVENGDLNWIVPKKFLAFCGPHPRSKVEYGYPLHSPEHYFSYFRKNSVTTIVRLNKKIYDAKRFVENGFEHKDLFFVDGSTPSDAIMREFLQISENARGALAVHCKAGLGRTGTLIACYIMKHYHFTAAESIAWIRICRPGSIIGQQQLWLVEKERYLWLQGQVHSILKRANLNDFAAGKEYVQSTGDDAEGEELEDDLSGASNNLHSILNKVDKIKLQERNGDIPLVKVTNMNMNNINNNNESGEVGITQGDKLNRIKALRRQTLSASTGAIAGDDFRPHRRASSQPLRAIPPTAASSSSTQHPSPLKAVRNSAASSTTSSGALGHGGPGGAVVRATSVSPTNPRRSPRINQLGATPAKSSVGTRSPATRSRMPR